jgi:hypothetical protein
VEYPRVVVLIGCLLFSVLFAIKQRKDTVIPYSPSMQIIVTSFWQTPHEQVTQPLTGLSAFLYKAPETAFVSGALVSYTNSQLKNL